MTSNWKTSEWKTMALPAVSLWSHPCPECSKKGLHFSDESERVICHACGYETKVIR